MKHNYTVYSVLRGISTSLIFSVLFVFGLPLFMIVILCCVLCVLLTNPTWGELKETWRDLKEDTLDGIIDFLSSIKDLGVKSFSFYEG